MSNFEGRDGKDLTASPSGDRPQWPASGGRHVEEMLEAIVGRIAAAERRQSDALDEMQRRIAQLSTDARQARPNIPDAFKDVFDRVEFAMADLACRIAKAEGRSEDISPATASHDGCGRADAELAGEKNSPPGSAGDEHATDQQPDVFADADRSAPPALKSAVSEQEAERFARAAERNRAGLLDPFDFADEVTAGNPEEPWDATSAEELTRAYESGVAGLPPMQLVAAPAGPDYMNSISYHSLAAAQASQPEPQPDAANEAAPATEPAAPDFDKDWLEERFAEVATRVEQILASNRDSRPLEALTEHFVNLEQRFGQAVEDLAKRSDVAGLGDVEACIAEMAAQLEYTARELGRVSQIEEQVKTLALRVSDERLAALMPPPPEPVDVRAIADVVVSQLAPQLHPVESPAPQPVDVQAIADVVADRLASQQRPAEPAAPGIDKSEIDEIKTMIGGLVSARQSENEHTSSMLDTMQQAMIRLLDRMDAIEDSAAAAPLYVDASQGTERASPQHHVDVTAGDRSFSAHAATSRGAETPASNEGDQEIEPAPQFGTRKASPAQAEQPSLSDYTPRRIDELEYDREPTEGAAAAQPVAASADRRQFMESARRAARQANERARDSASPETGSARPASSYASTGGQDAADRDDASARSGGGTSGRVRVMVTAFALLALGLGATKLIMSPPDVIKRAFTTPETKKRDMLGHNGTPNTAPAPAPAAPAPVPAGKNDKGAATHVGVQPAGVRIAPSQPQVTASDVARQQQYRQYAAWSTGVGAQLPTAQGVPPSMMPTAAPEQPAPEASTPVTSLPNGQRVSALPSALVGPLSLRVAAANGDPSAEFEVGARFAEGKGVQQDFKQAVSWYRRSATRGFALAQYRLATLYERGLGVTKDLGRARIWYQRAASQGNVKAMHNLAVLAAGSEAGKTDYTTAARWFEEAASRGLADSQFNLAILYQSGLGVERDLVKSYTWFGIAARGGDKTASERQAKIARKLKAVDIARADQA
ncbi:MAG: sel1 repeat family protein, partial [Hyphomicrobiaceae bacterium]|nr:sel1 repeat family protein [Hyphomicrobiaceae bacterium]